MCPNWQDELKTYFGDLDKKSRATHILFLGLLLKCRIYWVLEKMKNWHWTQGTKLRQGSCTATFLFHCLNVFKHDPRAKLGLLSFGVKYVSGILLLLLTDFGQWQITFRGFGVTEPKPGLAQRGLLMYLVCIQIPLREPSGLSSHQPCHNSPKASTPNTVQPSHISTYNWDKTYLLT